MELYKTIMADPFLQGLVLAVLGGLGAGLAVIWKALTRAIVRALDQVAPNHRGDDRALVAKVRQHEGSGKVESLMLTMAPGMAIEREVRKRASQVPPQDHE